MASLQMHSAAFGQHSSGKITKSRSRNAVKPILKKLHSHHSDRGSLDLDRGWDDQPSPRLASLDYGYGPYDSDGAANVANGGPSAARTPRDVSFSFGPSDLGAAAGGAAPGGGAIAIAGGSARAKYSHARSTSGTSHASIATTTSGGRNGGSFVHPFQQTPHASTLPLSYSRASLDNPNGIAPRDYSPTITEDGDDLDPYASYHSTASSAARPPVTQAAYLPPHRRPSLASQRTSSVSDGMHTLRASASRSNSGSVQRFASSSLNQSRSELQLSAGTSVVDSPLSTTAPLATSGTTLSSAQATTTTAAVTATATTTTTSSSFSSSINPMSPLRNSLDMGFRLRSRSEVDTATRQEQVREARRKFEAKERAKEEKYAREQVRKRERADSKEAQKQEREQTRLRKGSHASLASATNSNGCPHRRRGTGSKADGADDSNQKGPFSGQAPQAQADDVQFKSSKRAKTAKHKTVGVWTAFMLWLRTRLLKLGRR
ncbi:hypothetical protein TOPH_03953 [Tolypocladium ophioglossoides CBS 100239]|uniref:Uncharacterized protein n=1 Tax=Tolypocladium ophioglossoides (strain CBS 100239) TaxID=1163406 RepID=A0A0L0NB42_TOLOC|nr:hypothetical protein TOPH_03953 [Tolypocladium ophioglossoides CBS 100239]